MSLNDSFVGYVIGIVLGTMLGISLGVSWCGTDHEPTKHLSSTTYCQSYGQDDKIGLPRKCQLEAVMLRDGISSPIELLIDLDKLDGGILTEISVRFPDYVELIP